MLKAFSVTNCGNQTESDGCPFRLTAPTLTESLHTYTRTRRETPTLQFSFLSARLPFIFLTHLELFPFAPDFLLKPA